MPKTQIELKKPEEVKGCNALPDSYKLIFSEFLKYFYRGWEYPEKHIPQKVQLRKDKSNGVYIRVDLENGEWYHVKNATCWY
jgi:hypothetical protein